MTVFSRSRSKYRTETGPGLAGFEPFFEMVEQRPAIVQAREVVVVGQIPKALLGLHPRLHLGEEGRDRLQGVELGGVPLPIADLDEPENARW